MEVTPACPSLSRLGGTTRIFIIIAHLIDMGGLLRTWGRYCILASEHTVLYCILANELVVNVFVWGGCIVCMWGLGRCLYAFFQSLMFAGPSFYMECGCLFGLYLTCILYEFLFITFQPLFFFLSF